MIKTKNGREIDVGDWVQDTDGIFEITEIDSRFVYAKEVIFEGNSEEYHLDGEYIWTHKETRQFKG